MEGLSVRIADGVTLATCAVGDSTSIAQGLHELKVDALTRAIPISIGHLRIGACFIHAELGPNRIVIGDAFDIRG